MYQLVNLLTFLELDFEGSYYNTSFYKTYILVSCDREVKYMIKSRDVTLNQLTSDTLESYIAKLVC